MSVLAIADTGFLYAYLDPDDQHHVWACEQFSHFPSFITVDSDFLIYRRHGNQIIDLITP